MQRRSAALILAILALGGLVAAAAAQAQSPFQNLSAPSAPQTTTVAPSAPVTTTPSPTSSSSNGGLSTSAEIAIFVGAILLIVLIGWVIMRDARRAAPVRAREPGIAGGRAASDRAGELQRRRARAKQARRQRKRNKRAR